jgi:hypothetical protein
VVVVTESVELYPIVTASERYFVAFPRVGVDAVLEESLAAIAAVDGATIVLVELEYGIEVSMAAGQSSVFGAGSYACDNAVR